MNQVLEKATKRVRANGRGSLITLAQLVSKHPNHFHGSDRILTPQHRCDQLTHCPENDSCKRCYET